MKFYEDRRPRPKPRVPTPTSLAKDPTGKWEIFDNHDGTYAYSIWDPTGTVSGSSPKLDDVINIVIAWVVGLLKNSQ